MYIPEHHTTDNRKSIIEDSNQIFEEGNIFLKNLMYNPFNQMGVSLEFFETDKFIILCTQKGGSTFIDNILLENDLLIHNPNDVREEFQLNNNFIDLYNKNYKIENGNISEFIKIISGTSEKDLIIVTRNPILKWMSGVIQDLDILVNEVSVLKKLINYDKNGNPQQDILSLQRNILIDFLLDRFENHGTTAMAHSKLYNELFYQLLIVNNNINLSKLFIVDIDNPNHNLADILKKYYPKIKNSKKFNHYWTNREKHDYLFHDLRERIEDRDLNVLINSITNTIMDDYRWYLILLDKYKDNLWKG